MRKADLVSIAVTLISSGIGFFVSGPKLAMVAAFAGAILLAIVHFSHPAGSEKKGEIQKDVRIQDSGRVGDVNVRSGDVNINLSGLSPATPPAMVAPQPALKDDFALRLIKTRVIALESRSRGVLYELEASDKFAALVALFRNSPAALGQSNSTMNGVSAHLTFTNNEAERLDVTSMWIGEQVNFVSFPPGQARQLVIAIYDIEDDFFFALHNINSYFPLTYSTRARAKAIDGVITPERMELVQDCNRVEINLVGGSDDSTLFSAQFDLILGERGAMTLR